MSPPIARLFAPALVLSLGCGTDAKTQTDSTADMTAEVAQETVEPDATPPDTTAEAAVADASDTTETQAEVTPDGAVETAEEVASETSPAEVAADCELAARSETFGGRTWSIATLDPRCTDLAITNCTLDGVCLDEQKDHLIMVPDDITRQELWVHLGGSGGKPTNAKNIARAAATAGYRVIGLSYMNEPSVAARCMDPDTHLPYEDDCLEKVRHEVIYGADTAPWIQIGRPDSIESRLERLLAWLAALQPDGGWGDYLDANGKVRWNRVGMSGFSQGGGHVGLIGRDHALYRSVFYSKGAGVVGHPAGACTTTADCSGDFVCCDLARGECEEEASAGGTCVEMVIAPWVYTGVGGDPDLPRATPGSRMYGIINTNESAWNNSPETFEQWGMGARAHIVSADPEGAGPFNGAHVLSSSLPPCGSGSTHQSMGTDAIEPKVGGCGGSRPAMFGAWLYMMTHTEP